MIVVDEVGQFVARDVQKMLDLQGVAEQLGKTGRGKLWLVVTSQEKLNEVVGGLDDKRVELARLRDRFPNEVSSTGHDWTAEYGDQPKQRPIPRGLDTHDQRVTEPIIAVGASILAMCQPHRDAVRRSPDAAPHGTAGNGAGNGDW